MRHVKNMFEPVLLILPPRACSGSGVGCWFPWRLLPCEQGLLVFSFLGERDLVAAAAVCRLFRAWANDKTLWRAAALRRAVAPQVGRSWKSLLFQSRCVAPEGYHRKFTDTAHSGGSWLIATKMMASTSGELQGLGLWSFSPLGCGGPRVKMALYSHDDGESGSAQARACSTKGRPHLLLASTTHARSMGIGRVEFPVHTPVPIHAGVEYWVVAIYDRMAFHSKVNRMDELETGSIAHYASYAHVCEVTHAFKEPFPAQFPRQAGKREDTHGYYMCLVPRSALAVLEAMDDDPDAALIDQREKEAYHHHRHHPTLSRSGCEREVESAEEEDREGFESAAGICRHFKPFRMELQAWESAPKTIKRLEVAARVFCASCHALFSDRAQLALHRCRHQVRPAAST